MGNEHAGAASPDPHGGVSTFIYDGCGRPTSVPERMAYTAWLTGTATTGGRAPPGAAELKGTARAAAPCLRHCCEFRLCGSESQEQSIALIGFGNSGLIAAIERVCAFLTGEGTGGALASTIGGVDVHAELRGGALVCAVQLSDFTAQDLVVVQVELAVYLSGGTP